MVTDIQQITPNVERVLSITGITSGDERVKYLFRYMGILRMDSATAYDLLDESLIPLNLTPHFQSENGQHVVIIQSGRVQAVQSNPWINLIFFLITLVSVIFTGAVNEYSGPSTASLFQVLWGSLIDWRSGLPFAVSLMAILLAHEFGHYIVGRLNKSPLTLPYFIPLPAPFSPFGTMGAVIQMKAQTRNRRALLDIGLAGPLAGLIVAIPILIYGLTLSTVDILPTTPVDSFSMEGNSLLYLGLKYAIFQQVLPEPASFGGLHPVLYWIRYFFTGKPFPWGGIDVNISPVAFAGWAGIFVTALNLLPVGQLDGGHILYALFGKKVKKLFPFILGITILLGFAWSGWWLWTILLFFFGRVYDEPMDQITQLGTGRKVLAVIGLVIFFLVFTPIPLIITSVGP